MILRSAIQDVLFLDIETVPTTLESGELSITDNDQILCICVGKIGSDSEDSFLKLRCFYNENENYLLQEFNSFLQKLNPNTLLYAHNGKQFDFPLITKRMLLNKIELPEILSTSGKNLAELNLVDSSELRRFTGLKHYTSLEFLSFIFKIDSENTDLEENNLQKEYYFQNDLQRLIDLCYRDVVTIAQLLLRFNNENTIRTENIYYV